MGHPPSQNSGSAGPAAQALRPAPFSCLQAVSSPGCFWQQAKLLLPKMQSTFDSGSTLTSQPTTIGPVGKNETEGMSLGADDDDGMGLPVGLPDGWEEMDGAGVSSQLPLPLPFPADGALVDLLPPLPLPMPLTLGFLLPLPFPLGDLLDLLK